MICKRWWAASALTLLLASSAMGQETLPAAAQASQATPAPQSAVPLPNAFRSLAQTGSSESGIAVAPQTAVGVHPSTGATALAEPTVWQRMIHPGMPVHAPVPGGCGVPMMPPHAGAVPAQPLHHVLITELLHISRQLYQKGEYKAAELVAERAWRLDPGNPFAVHAVVMARLVTNGDQHKVVKFDAAIGTGLGAVAGGLTGRQEENEKACCDRARECPLGTAKPAGSCPESKGCSKPLQLQARPSVEIEIDCPFPFVIRRQQSQLQPPMPPPARSLLIAIPVPGMTPFRCFEPVDVLTVRKQLGCESGVMPPCCPFTSWIPPMPTVATRSVLAMAVSSRVPGDSVRVSVQGKQIRVITPCFEANCDRMSMADSKDRLVLEGNVCVASLRNDRTAKIVGQRVVVNLRDGSLTISGAASVDFAAPKASESSSPRSDPSSDDPKMRVRRLWIPEQPRE